jgi:hypothetical protein
MRNGNKRVGEERQKRESVKKKIKRKRVVTKRGGGVEVGIKRWCRESQRPGDAVRCYAVACSRDAPAPGFRKKKKGLNEAAREREASCE